MQKLDSVIVRLVMKMKVIVIFIMSVKLVFSVDQTIVQLHLVLILMLIVVISMIINVMISVVVLTGNLITIVMIKTTIVDVNGMEETVVVVM